MSHIDKLMRHEALMTRMAERNGADFALAGQVGLIDPEEVFAATLSCTGCAGVDACEEHLEGGQEGFPAFCRNQETIRRLHEDMSSIGLTET
ncbi:MAG: hypothetical protein KJO42_16670 [Silicimonas sp.]|nr:hypothetical protein [Silicimonas sp.]NND22878.1 hypothetical protein [Silicimonas sp.]NND42996.1 hypothetical protein [Silicimonas sp.]NNF90296.1 hypothetical protein [Boseongicola sp.]